MLVTNYPHAVMTHAATYCLVGVWHVLGDGIDGKWQHVPLQHVDDNER